MDLTYDIVKVYVTERYDVIRHSNMANVSNWSDRII